MAVAAGVERGARRADRAETGRGVGGRTHVAVVVRIPQPVEHEAVDHGSVAHPRPKARLGKVVRHVGHRLHPTRDKHVRVPQHDLLRAQRDRLHAGRADLVDGRAAGAVGKPGHLGGLAGRGLAHPGRNHVAHPALLHALLWHARTVERRADCSRAKFWRLERGERAVEATDRSPRDADDDGIARRLGGRREAASALAEYTH